VSLRTNRFMNELKRAIFKMPVVSRNAYSYTAVHHSGLRRAMCFTPGDVLDQRDAVLRPVGKHPTGLPLIRWPTRRLHS
jgi:hypothetical protein